MKKENRFYFEPRKYKNILIDILKEIEQAKDVYSVLKKYPKDGNSFFSKDNLVAGYRYLVKEGLIDEDTDLFNKLKMKPIRTSSGVTVVTVLTKPFGCPGNCIFCPEDIRLPKSYLASEPGAQRALMNDFDPYLQTYNRLLALKSIGHNVEKVELIVLGGTWSFYKEPYKIWFAKRCFNAMNDFNVRDRRKELDTTEVSNWKELEETQKENETSYCRNVGLVFETRPDWINEKEVKMLRRLGATKIQIGIQSLDNKILKANKRGHGVRESKKAFELLREAGFKIHAHWMPNLYMSSVKEDKKDYLKLWKKDFRPDELKIYPTSLLPNTELEEIFNDGRYTPYTEGELKDVLRFCLLNTPRYCRLTRIIRDIPAGEILEGNKKSNMRQIVEKEIEEEGLKLNDIRGREIRGENVNTDSLEEEIIKYSTSVSTEYFISYKTKINDKICGFLRLSIPKKKHCFIEELSNSSIIREVHVYGNVVGIGKRDKGKSQHLGLGKKMISISENISKENGFKNISVISAIGTRKYYQKLGFKVGELYMEKGL